MKFDRRSLLVGAAALPVAISAPVAAYAAPVPEAGSKLAKLLHRELVRRGVTILPADLSQSEQGHRIGGQPTHGGYWAQMHVYLVRSPAKAMAALASAIAVRSSVIRFGYLWIPSNGVISATRHDSGDVLMRELVMYDVDIDEEKVISRVDALFAHA